jgi:hypothetical protein
LKMELLLEGISQWRIKMVMPSKFIEEIMKGGNEPCTNGKSVQSKDDN